MKITCPTCRFVNPIDDDDVAGTAFSTRASRSASPSASGASKTSPLKIQTLTPITP